MNRLSDQGRGYTWTSMRMTERRWRRRIGTSCTSSSRARSSSRTAITALPGLPLLVAALPVDLGVRLAQVQRAQLPQGHELLANGLRMGQLDQGSGRRIGGAHLAELGASDLSEHARVAESAVAHDQALLARRQKLPRQVFGLAEGVLRQALGPAGDLAVEGVEHLAAASVEHGDDQAVGVADAKGEQVEARHA